MRDPVIAAFLKLVAAASPARPRHQHMRAVRRVPGPGQCVIGEQSSLRKRMRAARRGFFQPPAPDKAAMRRHAWRRRMEAAARLRISFGQEWPGDREMIS